MAIQMPTKLMSGCRPQRFACHVKIGLAAMQACGVSPLVPIPLWGSEEDLVGTVYKHVSSRLSDIDATHVRGQLLLFSSAGDISCIAGVTCTGPHCIIPSVLYSCMCMSNGSFVWCLVKHYAKFGNHSSNCLWPALLFME